MYVKSLQSLKVTAGDPDADLYNFVGTLESQNATLDLDLKQFLHRGTILKNSRSVDAVVIYTGVETRLVMNQGKYTFK